MIILNHIQALFAAAGQVACDPEHGTFCDTGLPTAAAGHGQLQQVLQIVFGVFAAIAVLMLVIAGLRLVIAQGSPQEVVKARNTIIYAVVGLVIALSGEAIVALVLSKA